MIGALSLPFGNLFGVTVTHTSFFMGPDCLLFSLIAAYLVFFAYNFKAVRASCQKNQSLCCSLIIISIFSLLMIMRNVGFRLGGFINGGLLGLWMARELKDPNQTQQYQMPRTRCRKLLSIKNFALAAFIVVNTLQLVFLFK